MVTVWGLRFRVWGSRFEALSPKAGGLGFKVYRVQKLGLMVVGLELRFGVSDLGAKIPIKVSIGTEA